MTRRWIGALQVAREAVREVIDRNVLIVDFSRTLPGPSVEEEGHHNFGPSSSYGYVATEKFTSVNFTSPRLPPG